VLLPEKISHIEGIGNQKMLLLIMGIALGAALGDYLIDTGICPPYTHLKGT
jgi:hypothetical protein